MSHTRVDRMDDPPPLQLMTFRAFASSIFVLMSGPVFWMLSGVSFLYACALAVVVPHAAAPQIIATPLAGSVATLAKLQPSPTIGETRVCAAHPMSGKRSNHAKHFVLKPDCRVCKSEDRAW